MLVCSAQGGEWYWNEGKQPQVKDKNIEEKKVSNEDGKLLCEIETNMIFEIGDKPVDLTKKVLVSQVSWCCPYSGIFPGWMFFPSRCNLFFFFEG